MERVHRLGKAIPKGKRPIVLKQIDHHEKELILHNAEKAEGQKNFYWWRFLISVSFYKAITLGQLARQAGAG